MINIIEHRKKTFVLSGILFLTSLFLLFSYGLKPGIDFTGGTLMELTFPDGRPALEDMQRIVDGIGYGSVLVQPTGEEGYLLKMRYLSEEEHQAVLSTVRDAVAVEEDGSMDAAESGLVITTEDGQQLDASALGIEVGTSAPSVIEERVETIGPSISAELSRKSWEAGIAVIFAIVLFVAYAFRKVTQPVASWKYGLTAIVALIHDVTITMGVFALLGHIKGVEIDIPFVVAILTILGYSVNDTIVVFDRVREKLLKRRRGDFAETVNMGVQETIPRSINTSVTTLLVLGALYAFGGASIHYFALALIIGIALGTYSSIFLASPLLVEWERAKRRT